MKKESRNTSDYKKKYHLQNCSRLRRFLKNEKGAVLIFYAAVFPIILAFSAFAVDFGFAYGRKGGMQAAADAAAMAGALEFVSQNPSGKPLTSVGFLAIKAQATNEVYASLRYAGYSNGINDGLRTVTVNSPIIDDTVKPYTVTVSFQENRVLPLLASVEKLLGKNYQSSAIGVRASARAIWRGDNCLLALKKSGAGFTVNGSATIGSLTSPQCGIAVDSSDACALDTKGTSVSINVPVYTVGGICMTGSPATPPVTHGYYLPDPYEVSGTKSTITQFAQNATIAIASQTCTGSGATKSCTLPTPASNEFYLIDPMANVGSQGTLTLSSGTFVFKGPFTPNAQQKIEVASGANATIIYSGSSTSLSSGAGVTVNIKAPSSGSLAGVAFACLSCNSVNLTGGPSFSGSIYAPSATVSWSGTGSSPCTQIVANIISISGNISLNDNCITSNTSANYYARLTE